MSQLLKDHLAKVFSDTYQAMEKSGYDLLVISSGSEEYYFSDDRGIPFKTVPHFSRYCSVAGAGHLIVFDLNKGNPPKLFVYSPDDFWHGNLDIGSLTGLEFFDVEEFSQKEKRFSDLQKTGVKTAFIGPENELPAHFDINPENLVGMLDWNRSIKTPWEVEQIRRANELAHKGHLNAQRAFHHGKSEFTAYLEYVSSVKMHPGDLPYEPIVGIDENAAILHYPGKAYRESGTVLLVDAGASVNGYASDVTRTTLNAFSPMSVHGRSMSKEAYDVFSSLLEKMETLHLDLISKIQPGKNYRELHVDACLGVFEILRSVGVFQKTPQDDFHKISGAKIFFPHGLGHMLGIQVHDVAGKQMNVSGDMIAPDGDHPFLRNLRPIEPGHVFTVEPGLYFIPSLIEKARTDANLSSVLGIDNALVESLIPFGGIRIEDNIFVGEKTVENLTRDFFN